MTGHADLTPLARCSHRQQLAEVQHLALQTAQARTPRSDACAADGEVTTHGEACGEARQNMFFAAPPQRTATTMPELRSLMQEHCVAADRPCVLPWRHAVAGRHDANTPARLWVPPPRPAQGTASATHESMWLGLPADALVRVRQPWTRGSAALKVALFSAHGNGSEVSDMSQLALGHALRRQHRHEDSADRSADTRTRGPPCAARIALSRIRRNNSLAARSLPGVLGVRAARCCISTLDTFRDLRLSAGGVQRVATRVRKSVRWMSDPELALEANIRHLNLITRRPCVLIQRAGAMCASLVFRPLSHINHASVPNR